MIGKNLRKTIALTIALNVLSARNGYAFSTQNISKNNSNCKKQVILLMIPNGDIWNCLVVKKLSIVYSNNVKTRW